MMHRLEISPRFRAVRIRLRDLGIDSPAELLPRGVRLESDRDAYAAEVATVQLTIAALVSPHLSIDGDDFEARMGLAPHEEPFVPPGQAQVVPMALPSGPVAMMS